MKTNPMHHLWKAVLLLILVSLLAACGGQAQQAAHQRPASKSS